VGFQNSENDILLARTAHVLYAHGFRKFNQLADGLFLQLPQAHQVPAFLKITLQNDLIGRKSGMVFLMRSVGGGATCSFLVLPVTLSSTGRLCATAC
jgi:hypothetical protein